MSAVFFPAQGKSNEEITVVSVLATKNADVLKGHAVLPGTDHAAKVLIYRRVLENNEVDLRLVSAYCPHQGYDLTQENVKSDGNVYCSLHMRPICIYSEHNQAFRVKQQDGHYIICASC